MTSLADILVTQQSKGATKLEKISKIINWKRLGSKLDLIIQRGKMGRPPYPSLSLFKVLVLQRLYNVSDPQMEEMLYDRLSFRRFCDFGLTDKLPDETTICKFRGALGKKVNTLLEAVLQDLADQGKTMKGGASYRKSSCHLAFCWNKRPQDRLIQMLLKNITLLKI